MEEGKGYGYRCIVESVSSSMKRAFGEYVASKKVDNILNEIGWKAQLYNGFTELTPQTRT